MEEKLKLTGSKADYSVQEVAVPSGGIELAIIGTTPKTQNEIYSLTGYLQIQFKDGVVDLSTTSLDVNSIINKSTNTIKKEYWTDDEDNSTIEEGSQNYKAKIWDISSSNIIRPQQATETVDFDYLNIKNNNTSLNIANKIQNTESEATQNNTVSLTEEKIKQTTTLNTQNDKRADVLNASNTNQEEINNTETIFNQIQGTNGPDRLIGLNGSNIIDGLRNTELENFTFIEELIGGPDSDIIYYRGFWGDIVAATTLEALINGNGGQNTIHVALDQSTNVRINGGTSNQNHLISEAPPGINTPWNPNFMNWNWLVNENGEYLLSGEYTQSKMANAKINELTPSFNSISSSSGLKLNLVRPTDQTIEVLNGTNQDDWILALEDTKFINAGNGNDTVIAKLGTVVDLGAGIDTVFSSSNNYTLSYQSSIYGARINLQNNTSIIFDDDMNLWSFDRIITTPDTIIDSKNNDIIFGNEENNTFILTGGNDIIMNNGGKNKIILENNPLLDNVKIENFNLLNGDKIIFDKEAMLLTLEGNYTDIHIFLNNNDIYPESFTNESDSILRLLIDQNKKTINAIDGINNTVNEYVNLSNSNFDIEMGHNNIFDIFSIS